LVIGGEKRFIFGREKGNVGSRLCGGGKETSLCLDGAGRKGGFRHTLMKGREEKKSAEEAFGIGKGKPEPIAFNHRKTIPSPEKGREKEAWKAVETKKQTEKKEQKKKRRMIYVVLRGGKEWGGIGSPKKKGEKGQTQTAR